MVEAIYHLGGTVAYEYNYDSPDRLTNLLSRMSFSRNRTEFIPVQKRPMAT